MKRKVLCLLTAAVLVLSLAVSPVVASASSDGSGDYKYGGPNGIEYPDMTLTVNDYNVMNSGPAQGTQIACDYITEKSGGKIKFDIYYGGTLIEAVDTFANTADGMADISYYMVGLTTGVMEVGALLASLYWREFPEIQGLTEISRLAFERVPEFQDELNKQGVQCIASSTSPGTLMVFRDPKKADTINTPDDLKGMVVQTGGEAGAIVYQKHGITPLIMGPADWYQNFERGVVDGLALNLPCFKDFGIKELIGSYLLFGDGKYIGSGASLYLANLDKWNSLDEDTQALLKEGFRFGEDFCVEYDYTTQEEVAEEEYAVKPVHQIPEEEMGPWYDLAMETIDIWKENVTKKTDYDPEAVFEAYNKIIDEVMENYKK